MKSYNLTACAMFAVLSACSSAPKSGVEYAGREEVLSRIDELGSRPSWVTESEPFRVESGKVMSLGMTTVAADNVNLPAVYRISDSNGKAAISHAIEQRLEYVFQQGDQGTEIGANQVQFIATEGSKLTSSSLRATKHYWEKIRQVQENGQVALRMRVFSLVEMPEIDFRTALVDTARRAQGKAGVSQEFAKKLDERWTQFVAGDQGAKSGERKPTSSQTEE